MKPSDMLRVKKIATPWKKPHHVPRCSKVNSSRPEMGEVSSELGPWGVD